MKLVRPSTEAERVTQTVTDTREVTPADVKAWRDPKFQRGLRVNEKLLAVAREIKETEVIPGVITLGKFEGDVFLIDGQHRREAFLRSELKSAYVDVRVTHFKTFAEMSEEFEKLNSRISAMKPDDYLRAKESNNSDLAAFRKRVPFVGYDQIRRNERSPILSMSTVLRLWWASSKDTPTSGGVSAVEAAETLGADEFRALGDFLELAFAAWGRDDEYRRLWAGLNMVLCMWLYRRTVLSAHSARATRLDGDQFRRCMMALSADQAYLDWLAGRQVSEVNRSPGYRRLKEIFAKRLFEDVGVKAILPAPEWGGK